MSLTFQQELINLINRYSRENKSNTPDFILADFINESLLTFERLIDKRDEWHGYGFKPVSTQIQNPAKTPAPNISMDEFFIKD